VKNVTTRVTLDEKNMARERGLKEWIEGGWGWGQTETVRERGMERSGEPEKRETRRDKRRHYIRIISVRGLMPHE